MQTRLTPQYGNKNAILIPLMRDRETARKTIKSLQKTLSIIKSPLEKSILEKQLAEAMKNEQRLSNEIKGLK